MKFVSSVASGVTQSVGELGHCSGLDSWRKWESWTSSGGGNEWIFSEVALSLCRGMSWSMALVNIFPWP